MRFPRRPLAWTGIDAPPPVAPRPVRPLVPRNLLADLPPIKAHYPKQALQQQARERAAKGGGFKPPP